MHGVDDAAEGVGQTMSWVITSMRSDFRLWLKEANRQPPNASEIPWYLWVPGIIAGLAMNFLFVVFLYRHLHALIISR
jgi:hypothetical protein